MRRHLELLLTLLISVAVWALFLGTCLLLGKLRIALGCQANGYMGWAICVYVFLTWRITGKVWQLGLACAACNFMAYLAFRLHREELRQAFDALGDILIILSLFIGRGWGRKIGQKLKSTALTAINAASFKRQTAEAL